MRLKQFSLSALAEYIVIACAGELLQLKSKKFGFSLVKLTGLMAFSKLEPSRSAYVVPISAYPRRYRAMYRCRFSSLRESLRSKHLVFIEQYRSGNGCTCNWVWKHWSRMQKGRQNKKWSSAKPILDLVILLQQLSPPRCLPLFHPFPEVGVQQYIDISEIWNVNNK